ncbi:MAG: radical SAM protein [Candidatus Magnetomorum sp.]|nr:radical SAM protein [Candidatus Magnetomorum sp.]
MNPTILFKKNTRSVFFHITTHCNLSCRHCYIDPVQHGLGSIPLDQIMQWLTYLKKDNTDLVLLGGEPTLHPDLSEIVKFSRKLGFKSITIDTNGYLFHNILNRVTPHDVDFFSFSLDGPDASINDAIRGADSFETCTKGILAAREKGFSVSVIYTVSAMNLKSLNQMPVLIQKLDIQRFFIQVIGIRGNSSKNASNNQQINYEQWMTHVPKVAKQVVQLGIPVTYPKVFLQKDEFFECAGRVADYFFVFPNGRVYQCPLCEDYPIHSYMISTDGLKKMPPINEQQFFDLSIPEGCVMNKIVQPGNISYDKEGKPMHQIACCLLKEEA